MTYPQFPIQIKDNHLQFGETFISLEPWQSLWIPKLKTYKIELLCHKKVGENWYKTALKIDCENEGIWQRCVKTMNEIASRFQNSESKRELESYEYVREFNLTKDGIFVIIRSIQIPVGVEELENWIENPVSLMGKQDLRCGKYLAEQIHSGLKESNRNKVNQAVRSAATIPDFDFYNMLAHGSLNISQLQDSKS